MKRTLITLAACLLVAGLVAAGCSQTAPAPTAAPAPTQAPAKPAEPTKAPAPAAAPTAAPTAAPAAAPKVSWPEKGKSITVMVPWAAGSPNDLYVRVFQPFLEKDLGVQLQILNKPGATTQTGLAEFVQMKPDGYAWAVNSMPTTALVYLDPERKANFTRKSFQAVASTHLEPVAFGVPGNSPYKTFQDVINASKAKPESVKVGDNGLLSPTHLAHFLLAKAAGIKFAPVHFNGSNEQLAALLGGHIDAGVISAAGMQDHFKTGAIRLLGNFGTEENPLFPGAVPFKKQGYDATMIVSRGFMMPGGTPKEVVQAAADSIKRITENPEWKAKMVESGQGTIFVGTEEYSKLWDDMDKSVAPILDEAKKQ